MTDHSSRFTTQELREVFDVLIGHIEESYGCARKPILHRAQLESDRS
jgi:hypothetical protein